MTSHTSLKYICPALRGRNAENSTGDMSISLNNLPNNIDDLSMNNPKKFIGDMTYRYN
jgi:hypothetical protein